jgi:hypothetical protein
MLAACCLVCSSLLIKPLMALKIPGLTHLVMAPISAFFFVLGMSRTEKPGTVVVIAAIQSLLYVMISPMIPLFVMAGAIGAELVTYAIFRGVRRPTAKLFNATLYSMISFPVGLGVGLTFAPKMFAWFRELGWPVGVGIELSLLLLGLAGGGLGLKVAAELRRAGKLRPDSEVDA